MYHHLTFMDKSNPYICINEHEFLKWFRAYEMIMLKPGEYFVIDLRKKRTYTDMKTASIMLATNYSTCNDVVLSLNELNAMNTIFETLGKRYGLLKEFHENAIC